jgi:hypothetical protein
MKRLGKGKGVANEPCKESESFGGPESPARGPEERDYLF